MHRAQAAAAYLVNGHGRHRVGQAGVNGGLARRILANTRREHLAHDHLVDLFGRKAGALEQRLDDGGAEGGGGQRREAAAEAADGGAGGCDDDGCLGHDRDPPRGWCAIGVVSDSAWHGNQRGVRCWLGFSSFEGRPPRAGAATSPDVKPRRVSMDTARNTRAFARLPLVFRCENPAAGFGLLSCRSRGRDRGFGIMLPIPIPIPTNMGNDMIRSGKLCTVALYPGAAAV